MCVLCNIVITTFFSLQSNTFQSVIATNAAEDETYVINQYLDNGINWGQCNGINAQAGVTSATGSLGPPSSNTAGIVNVEMGSNVGEPGKYVYCVHNQDKEEPVSKQLHICFTLVILLVVYQ